MDTTKGGMTMEQKQVIDELNYHSAQKVTEMLYEMDLITFDEYERLTQKNRDTFSPAQEPHYGPTPKSPPATSRRRRGTAS